MIKKRTIAQGEIVNGRFHFQFDTGKFFVCSYRSSENVHVMVGPFSGKEAWNQAENTQHLEELGCIVNRGEW